MPVDQTMLDAMLGTFRNMLQDCRDKKLSGEHFDAMADALARMEKLGHDMNDVGAFSGQLMQEGLFMQFSDHYGKLLLAAAQQQSGGVNTVYDEAADKKLLNQSLQAYRDAIRRLDENKQQVKKMMGVYAADADVLFKDKAIKDAIQKLIDRGESGINYPQFLAAIMTEGLDRAMEGSVMSRASQVYLLESAQAMAAGPSYIKKEEDKLKLFDALAKESSLHIPATLPYTLGCEKIEWIYQPLIIKWNKIKEGWEKSIFWLDEWITAYCSFAPQINPWSVAKNPREAVLESQDCVPGKLRVWEKINQEYFNLSLPDLFRHESFAWQVTYQWLYWSQEYMEFLLKEVEPVCRPFQKPSEELVKKAAYFHQEKRKVSPGTGMPALRYAGFFDNYFGKGSYVQRFGLPEEVMTHAAPWDLSKFSF